MGNKNFKNWSRDDWSRKDDLIPNNEQLQIGCLQRIADATEIMAKNYQSILEDRDKYARYWREERAEKEALQRSVNTHKANYTRLKNKYEALKNDGKSA